MLGRVGQFGHWLATPIREFVKLFPFTHEGRQTLIYLMFSLSTVVLTLIVWWAMNEFFLARQWGHGAALANKVAWALLMSVGGYACFVSVRAIRLGKDGFGMEGRDPPSQPLTITSNTTTETTIQGDKKDV